MVLNNFSLVIPTYNAGNAWSQCLESIHAQSIRPKQLLVIDSNSKDSTAQTAIDFGCTVIQTDPATFNHGRVRNFALEFLGDVEFVVFLTQDAILESKFSLNNLLNSFNDPLVGMAYGRQLPHLNSKPLGAHARLFNYPNISQIRSLSDSKRYGIKTTFVSNSFATYRLSALVGIGGFPPHVILSEDTYVAAKMLLSNLKIAYAADATAFHSHDYSYFQEFRRYFDTGVFHSREDWILDQFGRSESEGIRFVKSELKYLFRIAPHLIPTSIARTFIKYLGFKLGQNEQVLPIQLKRFLSMHKNYWTKN
jgi:rhamnosyltransferase